MHLKLRHRLPLVVGAAVVLSTGSGAAAFALVGAHTHDVPTRSGNDLPIDDNHERTQSPGHGADDRVTPRATPSPSAEPGDDNRHGGRSTDGPSAAASDDRGGRDRSSSGGGSDDSSGRTASHR